MEQEKQTNNLRNIITLIYKANIHIVWTLLLIPKKAHTVKENYYVLDSNQIVSQCKGKHLFQNQMKTIRFFKATLHKTNKIWPNVNLTVKPNLPNKVTMLTAEKSRECLKEDRPGLTLTCVFIDNIKDQIWFLLSWI